MGPRIFYILYNEGSSYLRVPYGNYARMDRIKRGSIPTLSFSHIFYIV